MRRLLELLGTAVLIVGFFSLAAGINDGKSCSRLSGYCLAHTDFARVILLTEWPTYAFGYSIAATH